MTLPGPSFGTWAIELLVLAVGLSAIGEMFLRFGARFSPFLATLRPIERLLVDLYVGGAVLYVLAAVPLGLFYPELIPLFVVLSIGVLLVSWHRKRTRDRWTLALRRVTRGFATLPVLVALGSALVLFLIELAIAVGTPTGNTFDSSLLTFYVSRLLLQHSIPLSFLPSVAYANAYPQGVTVWIASAQSLFGLPPARAALLVTPLFMGLAPLGAYVVGDRLMGGATAGAVLAVTFAFVGSWTRVMAAGSNDFVLAFPLVLLLVGRVGLWTDIGPPRWADTIAYGGLTGVAVSLNPAGPIWLYLFLPLTALLARPAFAGNVGRWAARWTSSLLVGSLFAIPSLFEEVHGPGGLFHPGLPVGATVGPAAGRLTSPQFVGLADPELFRSTDVWLSPFPLLRAEIALFLVVGAFVLLYVARAEGPGRALAPFARVAGPAVLVAVAILGAAVLAGAGVPALGRLLALTSFPETSILLFTVYTMVAAVPVLFLVRWSRPVWAPDERTAKRLPRPVRARRTPVAESRPIVPWVAFAAVLLLAGSGIAITATSFPAYDASLYRSFGNVTEADFALLSWAGTHLPSGARVLVAPGSAAGFLPGYSPGAVVLFPMVDGTFVNASYAILVRELTNGTLDPTGESAMSSLSVGFVAVTEANSILYPPFLPTPLLDNPSYTQVFHDGDAYLFERAPG